MDGCERSSGGQLLQVYAVGNSSESLQIGRIPFAVAVGFGAVWVSDLVHAPFVRRAARARKVLRLDPDTNLDDVINVGNGRPQSRRVAGPSGSRTAARERSRRSIRGRIRS